MIDKLIKRLRNKLIMAHNGIPILYVVYKPQKDGKNVFTYIADPELGQDKELDYLFKTVADCVRERYADEPEKLEEILEIVRSGNREDELAKVVRCKDCEYDLSAMCPMIVDGEDAAPRADDYCSFGKRRGDQNGACGTQET